MLTIPFFHCVFNGDTSVTHYMHTDVDEAASTLPNQYIVLICDNKKNGRKVINGGVVIKTTGSHIDGDSFTSSLVGACSVIKELAPFIKNPNVSFLPARITMDPEIMLTENECLQGVTQQYMKHSRTLVM